MLSFLHLSGFMLPLQAVGNFLAPTFEVKISSLAHSSAITDQQ